MTGSTVVAVDLRLPAGPAPEDGESMRRTVQHHRATFPTFVAFAAPVGKHGADDLTQRLDVRVLLEPFLHGDPGRLLDPDIPLHGHGHGRIKALETKFLAEVA
jgi:hypothetical protein